MDPTNLRLLTDVGKELHLLGHEWLLGGDWNMTPEQLQETEWLQQAKASVVLASTAPTCNSKVLDYFVCSAGMAPMVRGAGQDEAEP